MHANGGPRYTVSKSLSVRAGRLLRNLSQICISVMGHAISKNSPDLDELGPISFISKIKNIQSLQTKKFFSSASQNANGPISSLTGRLAVYSANLTADEGC